MARRRCIPRVRTFLALLALVLAAAFFRIVTAPPAASPIDLHVLGLEQRGGLLLATCVVTNARGPGVIYSGRGDPIHTVEWLDDRGWHTAPAQGGWGNYLCLRMQQSTKLTVEIPSPARAIRMQATFAVFTWRDRAMYWIADTVGHRSTFLDTTLEWLWDTLRPAERRETTVSSGIVPILVPSDPRTSAMPSDWPRPY